MLYLRSPMKRAIAPTVHLFVCANERGADSPLGTGCGERGYAVYNALKEEVAKRRDYSSVWVTKTHCLGICPKAGATVAVYPAGVVLKEVQASDAPALYDECARQGAFRDVERD